MRGPFGTGRALGTAGFSGRERKNCHHTKNATDRIQIPSETQKLTRSPAK